MLVKIREAFPADDPSQSEPLVAAYLAIWNHSANLPFLSLTGLAFTAEQCRHWFAEHRAQGVRYFVAEDGDPPGIAGIMILHQDPVQGMGIGGIGVRAEVQARGIGRQLVERSLTEAALAGYQAIDVSTFAGNTRMLRLLIGLGFVPTAVDPHRDLNGEGMVRLRRYLPQA